MFPLLTPYEREIAGWKFHADRNFRLETPERAEVVKLVNALDAQITNKTATRDNARTNKADIVSTIATLTSQLAALERKHAKLSAEAHAEGFSNPTFNFRDAGDADAARQNEMQAVRHSIDLGQGVLCPRAELALANADVDLLADQTEHAMLAYMLYRSDQLRRISEAFGDDAGAVTLTSERELELKARWEFLQRERIRAASERDTLRTRIETARQQRMATGQTSYAEAIHTQYELHKQGEVR